MEKFAGQWHEKLKMVFCWLVSETATDKPWMALCRTHYNELQYVINLGKLQVSRPEWNIILPKIFSSCLKPLDTFGKQYCPRPTLCVSQLLYKITNLWKFRLNRSSESGENNGKTHPCLRTFRRVMTCV